MFIIIGIVVVFGSIVAGYLMEHGNLRVLLQPAELIIIGGAGGGTLLIGNPLHVVKKIAGGVAGSLKGSQFSKAFYLETLKMCYEILNKTRKDGLLAIESDIEEPDESAVFSKYPQFLKDHHARDFFVTRCGWRSPAASTHSILIK
jgi:chemotaxis protein MotA